jgi:hypothetical protein
VKVSGFEALAGIELPDGAIRVLTIVFALNLVWQPTTKRLALRVAPSRRSRIGSPRGSRRR